MSRLRLRIVRGLLRPARGWFCTPIARWPYECLTATLPQPPGVRFEPTRVNDVPGYWCTPSGAPADRVVLYLHGGGYVYGSAWGYQRLAGEIARLAGARGLAVEYRRAPEHPFPAAREDALAAYRGLLDQGVTEIALAGDSAGGGLSLALLAAVRDAGWTRPTAAYVISPWTDLAGTGESIVSQARIDPVLTQGMVVRFAEQYLRNGHSASDPLVSPLYGDLAGLPPIYVQVGTDEILRDDSVRYAEKAKAAGVETTLEVIPEFFHAYHVVTRFLPEAREAVARGARFLASHWRTPAIETNPM